jgi:hypothetical protein
MPDAWKHNIWFWVAATCLVVGVVAQWGPGTIQVLRDGEQETTVRPLDVVRINPPDLQPAASVPRNSLQDRSPVQLTAPETATEPVPVVPSVIEPVGVVALADSSGDEGVVRLGDQAPMLIAPRSATVRRSADLPQVQPSLAQPTPPSSTTGPVRLLGIQPILE